MRKHILFEEEESGIPWVATYYLGSEELDDSIEENDTKEIELVAEDFETAVKYAQQYLRKMQSEDETGERWANAQIVSVDLY